MSLPILHVPGGDAGHRPLMLRLAVPMLLWIAAAALVSAAPAVRVLAWDDGVAARKLALVAGDEVVELEGMHPQKRTHPVRLRGGRPFVIRALDREPGADGKPVDRACPIPDALQVPLVVLLPDAAHPTGIRPLVIDDNPANFRWGVYRFLNATPRELAVRMEDKVALVPVGWKPVDVQLGGEPRGFGALVALGTALDKPLYSAVWEYNPGVRTLCFMVPGTDPRLGPVAFKAIAEDRRTLEFDQQQAKAGESAEPAAR